MFVTVGPAGNTGVVDKSIAPWVMNSPDLHTTPCENIVLTGRNFQMDNFLNKKDKTDTVLIGAYVPFGTTTTLGQVIDGVEKCGGSILSFDAEQTIETFAWGFRNLIGITFDERTGDIYADQNGYDIRGARQVQDEGDPVYRVEQGTWYGVPDYSAALEPLTNDKFEPPDEQQTTVFVNGQPVGKTLDFLIDQEASGLTPPDPSLLVSLHPFNSSPSMLDVVPDSWGRLGGQFMVAEWGNLAPPINPLREEPVGSRIALVDPDTGKITPFVHNEKSGPASIQGATGRGLERPFDVQFGPDGALYIVDYGIVQIDTTLKDFGEPPYLEIPGSGAIWKITRDPYMMNY